MNIDWRIEPDKVLDATEFEHVNAAINLLEMTEGGAIESYRMGEDGPYLHSIFLVNSLFVAEVLLVRAELNFDVARSNSITNYRIKVGKTTVSSAIRAAKEESAPWESFDESVENVIDTEVIDYVTVTLNHVEGLRSKLNYFGESGDAWLKHVLKHYPISLLLKSAV